MTTLSEGGKAPVSEGGKAPVSEGGKAPDFNLQTPADGQIKLADFKGRKLVLYFYPKDDTPGCTTQAIDFSKAQKAFAKAGAAILGISKDSLARHEKFSHKHDLTIMLAADPEGETIEAFGAWVEKNMYGRKYMGIDRSTFLIDEKGIIRHIWRKVRVKGHVDKVLEVVSSL